MTEVSERREEKRLRYNWPVWFAHDFNDVLTQGQMVDICSEGASFTCYADKCPHEGGQITTRFSVPRYGEGDAFDLENYIREGKICRIDEVGPFVRRVAISFKEPLPFKPGEINDTEALALDDTIETVAVGDIAKQEAEAMADGLNAGEILAAKGRAAAEADEQVEQMAEEFETESETETIESAAAN